MADMAERGILVFDAHGLISNADKLSWKMKAIFAQEEREKIARKVRDNLAFLKRQGVLLGVIPQGYMRVDGDVVEDPDAAPVIRIIFTLYATGRYSFEHLAGHLNRQGIKPARGPKKENHSRPQAVIFTGDVVKDILKNRVYLGLVRVTRWRSGDEQWIEGRHPALVDQETWDACQSVRVRNRRCNSPVRKHWSYPLTPILRCAKCGGTRRGGTAQPPTRRRPSGARHRGSARHALRRPSAKSFTAACPAARWMRSTAGFCGRRWASRPIPGSPPRPPSGAWTSSWPAPSACTSSERTTGAPSSPSARTSVPSSSASATRPRLARASATWSGASARWSTCSRRGRLRTRRSGPSCSGASSGSSRPRAAAEAAGCA